MQIPLRTLWPRLEWPSAGTFIQAKLRNIRTGQVLHLLPLLETILTGFGERPSNAAENQCRAHQ